MTLSRRDFIKKSVQAVVLCAIAPSVLAEAALAVPKQHYDGRDDTYNMPVIRVSQRIFDKYYRKLNLNQRFSCADLRPITANILWQGIPVIAVSGSSPWYQESKETQEECNRLRRWVDCDFYETPKITRYASGKRVSCVS